MKVTVPNDTAKKVTDLLNTTFENSTTEIAAMVKNEASKIEVEIKSRIAVDKGTLKASIGVVRSKKNNYFFWIGPQYSNRNSAFEGGNHAHLVEYGSKQRYMKKGLLAGGFTRVSGGAKKFTGSHKNIPYAGKSTGVMTSKPFLRPTYDNLGQTIIDNLKKFTAKIVSKNGAKQGL